MKRPNKKSQVQLCGYQDALAGATRHFAGYRPQQREYHWYSEGWFLGRKVLKLAEDKEIRDLLRKSVLDLEGLNYETKEKVEQAADKLTAKPVRDL